MKKAVSVLISLVLVVFIVLCMSSCVSCSDGHADNNLDLVCDVCESKITAYDIKPIGFATQKFHFPDLEVFEEVEGESGDVEIYQGIYETLSLEGKPDAEKAFLNLTFIYRGSINQEIFETFENAAVSYDPLNATRIDKRVNVAIPIKNIDLEKLKNASLVDEIIDIQVYYYPAEFPTD